MWRKNDTGKGRGMTREEAIEIIKRENNLDKDVWNIFPEYRESLELAIEVLNQKPCEDCISRQAVLDCQRFIYDETGEELEVIHAESVLNLPPVKPQEPKWIPVSERLPKIHNYMQEYIVTIKGNFTRTAFFTETNGKSWWSIDNVIAWMPLPKPYEPQESEG